jgi:AcrR family transcriptional regulator
MSFTLQSHPGHENQSPSLYAAFGNKEQLFKKVLDQYLDGRLFWQGFGGTEGAERRGTNIPRHARMAEDPRLPAGCLMATRLNMSV